MSDTAVGKVSFFAKKKVECPVCGAEFQREEALNGRGRIIAGELTHELRRLYEPSKKFGEVFPLIYPVLVCPECFYAAFVADFEAIPDSIKEDLLEQKNNRLLTIKNLLGPLDFTEVRGPISGLASYILADLCYEHFPSEFAPSFKGGLSTIRAAWICNDLHAKYPGENYDYLAQVFYRKSSFYYGEVLRREQSGKESVGQIKYFGPDTDNNYGFEGVLYLAGLLEFKYGSMENSQARKKSLEKARSAVSRIVGMGKSSKSKPSVLLDMARDLHKSIGLEMKTNIDE